MVTEGHGRENNPLRGAIDGGNIWWVAPSYPIASDIWRDLKKACRDAWTDKSEVERRIELPGGGAVTVKSSDHPESLRGAGLDGVVLDEAANIKPDAWLESIRPALSDKQGWAVFIGTPHGFNWFHDLFRDAEYMPGWARWQRPSADNPLLTKDELATARKEIGSVFFSQEYEAQFVAYGAGMFQRDWFSIVGAAPADALRCRYWDKAGTEGGGDWSAGVLIAKAPDGVYCIEDVQRGQWSALRRNQIMLATTQMDAARYRQYEVGSEQEPGSSGKESAEQSVKMLAGYRVFSDKVTGDKVTRARPLAAQCEARNVRLVTGPWNWPFVDELCAFPHGQHDDQVDGASGAFNRLALRHTVSWGDDTPNQADTAPAEVRRPQVGTMAKNAPSGAWG